MELNYSKRSPRDKRQLKVAIICLFGAIFSFLLPEGSVKQLFIWANFASFFLNLAIFFFWADSIKDDDEEYRESIESLGKIDELLVGLKKYIQREQDKLSNIKQNVSQLSAQKSELEPLVRSDQNLVDAYFREGAKQYRKGIWKERVLGFVIGVLSSLSATFIYQYLI